MRTVAVLAHAAHTMLLMAAAQRRSSSARDIQATTDVVN